MHRSNEAPIGDVARAELGLVVPSSFNGPAAYRHPWGCEPHQQFFVSQAIAPVQKATRICERSGFAILHLTIQQALMSW